VEPPADHITGSGCRLCHPVNQHRYAAARGVTIIGEMDVPGHASGLTAVLPDVFAFKSQPSLGVVNFVNSDTVKALQTIFDEIQGVWIHTSSLPCVDHCGDQGRLCDLRALCSRLPFPIHHDGW
jgi:hypothetical protein